MFIQSRLPLSTNITVHATVYSYPPYPGSSSNQSLRNPFPAIDRHAARFMLLPPILLTQDELIHQLTNVTRIGLCSYFCSRSYPRPHSYPRIPLSLPPYPQSLLPPFTLPAPSIQNRIKLTHHLPHPHLHALSQPTSAAISTPILISSPLPPLQTNLLPPFLPPSLLHHTSHSFLLHHPLPPTPPPQTPRLHPAPYVRVHTVIAQDPSSPQHRALRSCSDWCVSTARLAYRVRVLADFGVWNLRKRRFAYIAHLR